MSSILNVIGAKGITQPDGTAALERHNVETAGAGWRIRCQKIPRGQQ